MYSKLSSIFQKILAKYGLYCPINHAGQILNDIYSMASKVHIPLGSYHALGLSFKAGVFKIVPNQTKIKN